MLKKIFKRKQTCQTDSLQIQTACILTKTFTGMRPAHTTIQYCSGPILVTWSSSIFYNQLNSSHLGGGKWGWRSRAGYFDYTYYAVSSENYIVSMGIEH